MKTSTALILLALLCSFTSPLGAQNIVPQSFAVADDGTFYILISDIGEDGIPQIVVAAYAPDGTPAGEFRRHPTSPIMPLNVHADGDTLVITATIHNSAEDSDMLVMATNSDFQVGVDPTPRATAFALNPGYPNPINEDGAVISYSVPYLSTVRIEVRSLGGKVVQTLVDEVKSQGQYRAHFLPRNLSSGTYYIMLHSPEGVLVRKIALLR